MLAVHKPLMYADFYLRAFRVGRTLGADVVHAHDLNTLPVATALGRACGARVVLDAHELYPGVNTLSPRERRVWRGLERALLPHVDRVVTVCASIATELAERGAHDPVVLLNVPDAARQKPVDADALRSRTDLARGEPIVLYHGGFAFHRGLLTLIAAAAQLSRGVVVCMGSGRLEPELRRAVEVQGLADRVRIMPPVPLVPRRCSYTKRRISVSWLTATGILAITASNSLLEARGRRNGTRSGSGSQRHRRF